MSDKNKRERYRRLLAENMALSEKLANRCLDCDKIDAATVAQENAELKRQVKVLSDAKCKCLGGANCAVVLKAQSESGNLRQQIATREAELASIRTQLARSNETLELAINNGDAWRDECRKVKAELADRDARIEKLVKRHAGGDCPHEFGLEDAFPCEENGYFEDFGDCLKCWKQAISGKESGNND